MTPGEIVAGGNLPLASWMYISIASATWRMLLLHWSVYACRRTFASVGSKMLISTAMMPITTSNSTSVNARRALFAARFSPVPTPSWLVVASMPIPRFSSLPPLLIDVEDHFAHLKIRLISRRRIRVRVLERFGRIEGHVTVEERKVGECI